MSPLKFILFFALLFIASFSIAQDQITIDSLKKEIAYAKEDTNKVKRLIELARQSQNDNFVNSILFAKQSLDLSEKLKYSQGLFDAYNIIGDLYWYHSDFEKAQQYYFKAYTITLTLNDKKATAQSLYNIGWIIGIDQKNEKGKRYLQKSLQIYLDLKDTSSILNLYNAFGVFYSKLYEVKHFKLYFDSSKKYLHKGLELSNTSKFHQKKGLFYANLGQLFHSSNNFESSLRYEIESLNFIKDSTRINQIFYEIARNKLGLNQFSEAISMLRNVLIYFTRKGIRDYEMNVYDALAGAYSKIGDYKRAYIYYKQYVELKEKMDKEIFSTNINNMKNSFDLEKSEANVVKLTQANEMQELKNKKNTYFIFVLLAVALVIISVAALLYRQNKQKQEANLKLKKQNYIIFEKNHEIESSIQYAKGIQQAVLPNLSELSHQFENSFVYYKPKDIVSGDFYWFSKVENEFYCVVADCTGHGVPGALMSIIGIDKIVQAVFEKNITNPSEILSFLNVQIKKVLKQHIDKTKQMDGMDIALLKFNTLTNNVEYVAANRPLYIVRNKQLIEYKADKISIAGFTPNDQIFATTSIQLEKNDNLYIFTDGYADQFGGPEGKKFMSKKLKDLLVSVADLSSENQKNEIDSAFVKWKKNFDQVDDVLLIGIKV